jgi:Biopolymer transport proteins
MEQQAVEAVSIAGSVPADLSIWSLIYKADFIVKLVLLILISASIWSWAIIFDKIKKLRGIAQKTNEFEDKFWSGSSLEELLKI